MDLNDYKTSGGQIHFWHQARLGLLDWLIGQVPGDNLNMASVGSGSGEELELLAHRGSVVGWEINDRVIALAKQSDFTLENFDISQNVPPDHYDLIGAFDVLEHINDDLQTLKNINACLRPGGYLLLTVPAHPWLFSVHDLALKHERRYAKKDLTKKLQTAGFKIETIGYWNAWLFPLVVIVRLFKKIFPPKIIKSEAGPLPKIINELGLVILKAENWLISKNFKFPTGLSLYVVAKKTKTCEFLSRTNLLPLGSK